MDDNDNSMNSIGARLHHPEPSGSRLECLHSISFIYTHTKPHPLESRLHEFILPSLTQMTLVTNGHFQRPSTLFLFLPALSIHPPRALGRYATILLYVVI